MIQYVAIEALKAHPKNPNHHSPEQIERLAELIQYQGWRLPIIVSKQSGFIISGHGRLEAAKKIELKEVPVSYQDFTSDEQEYAFLVSDNAIASWADLDLSSINTNITDLGPDFDIDLLGIENFVLEPAEKFEAQCDEDEVPEYVEPTAKQGDIFQLGRHKLICGSATIITHYQALLGEEKANIVITDPPYNVAYEGKTKDALTIENDSMEDKDFYKFLYDFYTNAISFVHAGSAIYVAHADSEGANFRIAMKDAGWLLKQCLIWVKHTFAMGRQDYHWRHEPILYGWAPGSAHNWYTDRKQDTVLEFNKPSRNGEHPTMKPVELIEYVMGNSSKAGDIVLDPFGGSGTTLIASEKTNRRCFMIELDPHYCDVIVSRWEKYTGQKAKLLNG